MRYGQRHEIELEAARRVAAALGAAEHVEVAVDLGRFGGSALTADLPVPKGRDPEGGDGIPITYVPARNTILLSLALAWAETLEVRDIFIGVNAIDYSGYPDCRPEFIEAFERVARLGTRLGVEDVATAGGRVETGARGVAGRSFRIHTPLIDLTKAEIIRRGTELGVDFGLTVSCYDPDPEGRACGECDACIFRRRGFEAAGVPDPTRYRRSAPGD